METAIHEESLRELRPMVDRLRTTLQSVLCGKDDVVELVVTSLLARGHLLIEDLPGLCLLYTSPSPRDATLSRMPSSA